MPTKISEKQLISGLVCFAAGVLLLINTPIFASPVRVSEKGILLGAVSCVLIIISMGLFKRAVIKVR